MGESEIAAPPADDLSPKRGRNLSPLVGWHPPVELGEWAQAHARDRGVSRSVVLTQALQEYRERVESGGQARPGRAHRSGSGS